MGKVKKKKKSIDKKKVILVFVGLLVIVVLYLISEIIELNRNGNINRRVATTVNSEEKSQTRSNENEDNNVVKFDSFIEETFSMQELENMKPADLAKVYKNNDEITVNISDCKKLSGSSSSKEGAIINAKAEIQNYDQFINLAKVIDENDYYYIIEVDYTYISPEAKRDYVQKMVVLKDSLYDVENEKFNSDNIDDIKIALDIKYYLKHHSNRQ